MTVGEFHSDVLRVLFERLGDLKAECEELKRNLRMERVHRKMWELRTDCLMEQVLCADCVDDRRDAWKFGTYDQKVGWIPQGCDSCRRYEPFMVMPNEVTEDDDESEECDSEEDDSEEKKMNE